MHSEVVSNQPVTVEVVVFVVEEQTVVVIPVVLTVPTNNHNKTLFRIDRYLIYTGFCSIQGSV